MASDVLSLIVGILGIILVLAAEGTFAYAAFWAFNIRRALTVRIYRSHAFGIGLVSLGWILIFFDYVLVFSLSTFLFVVINMLVSAMFFYYIDTSVLDGMLSDPLMRDTLHWRRIRRWMWMIFAIASVLSIYIASYYSVLTGGTILTGGNLSLAPSWVNFAGAFFYIFVVVATGLIVLPMTAMRSRDPVLRKQLAWLAGFAAVLATGGFIPTSPAYTSLVFIQQFAGAICLYKSATSLLPHRIARRN